MMCEILVTDVKINCRCWYDTSSQHAVINMPALIFKIKIFENFNFRFSWDKDFKTIKNLGFNIEFFNYELCRKWSLVVPEVFVRYNRVTNDKKP